MGEGLLKYGFRPYDLRATPFAILEAWAALDLKGGLPIGFEGLAIHACVCVCVYI